jgi:hypothetical protein
MKVDARGPLPQSLPTRPQAQADPMAVVDQYRRVHGLEHLQLADAAILPDGIRANTNAPTIISRPLVGSDRQTTIAVAQSL